jgi:transposase
MRKAYQSDLSDAEWSYIEPHVPGLKAPGRPRVHTLREIEILDAIFYIVRSGCAWRLLPHDFPPWKTVHHYFRTSAGPMRRGKCGEGGRTHREKTRPADLEDTISDA